MPKISLVKAIVKYNSHPKMLQNARYLLLQKAKDEYLPENIGKWECPGGIIHENESPEQAIVREMKEELPGLEFRIIKQLPTLESGKSRCEVYLISAASTTLRLSPEHSDYLWMKAEDVKKRDLVRYADLLLEFFNNPEKYLK